MQLKIRRARVQRDPRAVSIPEVEVEEHEAET